MISNQTHGNVFLLDTCIVQYLGSVAIQEEMNEILQQLVSRGGELAVSYYTAYETLRGATRQIEQKRRETLNKFRKYELSPKVIIWAALLNGLYREHKIEAGIDIGDEIIAATSINSNIPIITTNGQHFPRPFFDGGKQIITYVKHSRRDKIMALYVLKPDTGLILREIGQRK